ncbi:DUF5117 domain-containing protein [Marinihelvus fidelis]|uniref:DUF5117 domain-containing protein n=1 Tax=Marinihelvus fidelis TaxID=2613842 RepID=A0A5N0TFG4_9GAMM|nr:zinc-dependent metalloprotease [Marinihelvus fidelis]KAA9132616.1 DUF5117 domain-containing protein [Marinihelvus fidelis]
MTHRLLFGLLALLFTLITAPAHADALDEHTDGLTHLEGYFDLYWDDDEGRLLLRIDRMDDPFIYQASMARGVGSNDLGLDRGQLGDTRLVAFQRTGPKVLLVELNTTYRANSDDAAERAAVAHSFARSVIWGFDALAVDGDSVLVDATEFFLRDAHGLGERLARAKQGRYQVDSGRSAIWLPRTRAFPDNTEIEAVITYTGDRAFDGNGRPLSDILPTVVPEAGAITVHLHHSLVRLPSPGYTPLPLDPRAGMVPARTFADYASPIGEPLEVTYAVRHRLQRASHEGATGPAVEPIVYYVDPGVPEPVRSALLDGAAWWNTAFEAAGYEDAFQVRMLPEDADPMDVRYNVIQWVHRSTRGWSYGSSVVDPRTGEIIKGHVTLGSLRVRQDYLIAEGLLAPYQDGSDAVPPEMLEMSLARIRQLSAHEVGHTIGLHHNFAASVNDRSSVMDYPFPKVGFAADGSLDLSDAYGVGVGEWDRRTIDYAYRDFPAGTDEAAARGAILEGIIADGLLFVSDSDSRNPGTAHPDGNLWDNGADAIAEFEHLVAVRDYALGRFSPAVIRPGRPMATLEEALVPIYLLHRFQLQAVGKLIGGERFRYNLRGDGQPLPAIVDADRQRQAIDTLVGALSPGMLVLPEGLAAMIPPRPPGHPRDRETFDRRTGPAFDPLAPAAAATGLTLDVLLHPWRAARMNGFHAGDAGYPAFSELLDHLLQATWFQPGGEGVEGAIARQTGLQVLRALGALAADGGATGETRAQALAAIASIDEWLGKSARGRDSGEWQAHYAAARAWINALDTAADGVPGQVTPPPGSPIGG